MKLKNLKAQNKKLKIERLDEAHESEQETSVAGDISLIQRPVIDNVDHATKFANHNDFLFLEGSTQKE